MSVIEKLVDAEVVRIVAVQGPDGPRCHIQELADYWHEVELTEQEVRTWADELLRLADTMKGMGNES